MEHTFLHSSKNSHPNSRSVPPIDTHNEHLQQGFYRQEAPSSFSSTSGLYCAATLTGSASLNENLNRDGTNPQPPKPQESEYRDTSETMDDDDPMADLEDWLMSGAVEITG